MTALHFSKDSLDPITRRPADPEDVLVILIAPALDNGAAACIPEEDGSWTTLLVPQKS